MSGSEATEVDFVVVGGGLAGTSAGIVLARLGYAVAIIDTHAVSPPEFRAEKLGDPHVDLIRSLGLADIVLPVCTPVDLIEVHRFGRLYAEERRREYGFAYADVVNALRRSLPAGATLAVGRVERMEVGEDRQRVTLADGRRFRARLVVIATGLGDAIRRSVGIERDPRRPSLSLSLGFDLAEPAAAFPFESLTAYGHRRPDRLAYLTAFPIGAVMRANLFTYHETGDPWVKAFRKDPATMLRTLLPRLSARCRDFAVADGVDVRPMDLATVRGERRSGVVLIGDAFQTTCPIPGHGVRRVLMYVERLCTVHVPRWFATPGMEAGKLASFYDDPVKRATDAQATGSSLYARGLALERGLLWSARRLRNHVARRGLYATSRLLGRLPRQAERAAR